MSKHELYHVTLAKNAIGIEEKGVDPAYSQGKRKVCWYVSANRLSWALYHVQNRHKANLQDLAVVVVKIHPRKRIKTNKRGVWACSDIVRPEWMSNAPGLIDDDAERGLHVSKHFS